jgi:hypothetical protein
VEVMRQFTQRAEGEITRDTVPQAVERAATGA